MVGIIDAFTPAPRSSYVGSGDVLPLTSFWSVSRAYNGAYAAALGSACIVRRASDNAEMTATFLSSGELDAATVSAWAGGSNLFVRQLYDQTANGRHVVQTTSANQLQLLLTGGPNGKPCIESVNNANQVLQTAVGYNGVNPTSFMGVANRVAGTQGIIWINAGSNNIVQGTAGASWLLSPGGGGGFAAAATQTAWHDFQASMLTGSGAIRISGTRTTGGGTVGTGATVLQVAKGASTSTIRLCEAGIVLGVQWSATDETTMRANQIAFYGL